MKTQGIQASENFVYQREQSHFVPFVGAVIGFGWINGVLVMWDTGIVCFSVDVWTKSLTFSFNAEFRGKLGGSMSGGRQTELRESCCFVGKTGGAESGIRMTLMLEDRKRKLTFMSTRLKKNNKALSPERESDTERQEETIHSRVLVPSLG